VEISVWIFLDPKLSILNLLVQCFCTSPALLHIMFPHHNTKQGSPVLQRDSLRPSANGAGSSEGEDEKLFIGSKPSWMSAPIKPGQFAASLGFKPVQIPAKASVTLDTPLEGGPGGIMPQKYSSLAGLSLVPKDGLAVATGAGKSVAPERSRLLIVSSDSDS
jgi:hypothetical protein